MDILVYVLLAADIGAGRGAGGVLMRRSDARAQGALADTVQRVEQSLREQERTLANLVGDRLDRSEKATGQVVTDLRERLASIDEAQRKIGELSTQVVSLQQILTNKQARGAFGEVQLNDLVSNALPPSAYELQCTLSSGARVDCLFEATQTTGLDRDRCRVPTRELSPAARGRGGRCARAGDGPARLPAAMRKHINDIREIHRGGETANRPAVPAVGAIYAELHANFGGIVDETYGAGLDRLANDHDGDPQHRARRPEGREMREQAGEIQKLVALMMGDTGGCRSGSTTSSSTSRRPRGTCARSNFRMQIMRRGERIQSVELGDQPDTLPKP